MQKVCIIVPCHNEEKRILISDFSSYIKKSGINFCFVNDGSQDGTIRVLRKLSTSDPENILVVDLKKNLGKAEAIRSGVKQVINWKDFDLIGYFDADLATPLFELDNLVSVFEKYPDISFAMASRVKLMGRNIQRTVKRHILGRIFATFASAVLKLPVYDTQCGAKVIRRDVAKAVFESTFISSWLFDIELLARLRIYYGDESIVQQKVMEVPLHEWIEKKGSSLKLKHYLIAPFQLLKIYCKY